jgi:hypothetical protein
MRTILAAAFSASALFLAAPARADGTRIEIRADANVQLEARADRSEPWRVVCAEACTGPQPTNAVYRVVGADVRSSDVFRLEPNGDRARVTVDTRPKGAFTAGVVLTILGASFLTTAAGAAVVDHVMPRPTGGGVDVVTLLIGTVALVLGATTLVPGVILMAHNGSSRVSQE